MSGFLTHGVDLNTDSESLPMTDAGSEFQTDANAILILSLVFFDTFAINCFGVLCIKVSHADETW